MWKKESKIAEEMLREAGFGRSLNQWSSSTSSYVCLTFKMPYLRLGGEAPSEYTLCGISMSPLKIVSAVVYDDQTGKVLKSIRARTISVDAVKEVVQELVDWWKLCHQKPAFA